MKMHRGLNLAYFALTSLLLALACNTTAPLVAPTPPIEAATPIPAASPLPSATPQPVPHRIAVRTINGIGEFYDRITGDRFVPRGMNYARIDNVARDGSNWHSTFDPFRYDAAQMEQALARMQSDGFNVVRVFVDCCSSAGRQVGSRSGALNQKYMAKVVDFLERAGSHHVYVLLILDLTPGDGRYNDSLWSGSGPDIGGENVRYLTAGGMLAKSM